MKDSIYFKNKNKDCAKEIITEYKDCDGSKFCITTHEDPIYIQENEIHTPVSLDMSIANSTYYSGKITKDVYKLKGKSYMHTSTPFKVGDIIKVKGDTKNRYFIKSKLRYKDKSNNFIFTLKRTDGYSMIDVDFNKLKKNKVIFIKGYFGSVG